MQPASCKLWTSLASLVLLDLFSFGCSRQVPPSNPSPGLDGLNNAAVVDLSHPLDESTLYWPTSPSAFELERLSHGHTDAGYFYAANRFCTPEHGGTHLDAPIHFGERRWTAAEIPVERLIGPAVVIDVRAQCRTDPDYRLTRADLDRWEAQHGPIARGSFVLLWTGWAARWPDRKAYFGDDTPGSADHLHFPSYGEEAALWLIEARDVRLLGVDTASIDYGPSQLFEVHRVAAAHEVTGLENLRGLEKLPSVGAWVVALPMKIVGGSGSPVRAVALVP